MDRAIITDRDNTEIYFLDTISEINERLSKGDNYNLIKASGLLRLLFCEGHKLVYKVNKFYRLGLVFCVQKNDGEDKYIADKNGVLIKPSFHYVNVDPFGLKTKETENRKLDAFLNFKCLCINDDNYSVRDFIKVCAHHKGGVHYDMQNVKDKKNKRLLGIEKSVFFGDLPATTGVMVNIINVALTGIAPLELAVLKNQGRLKDLCFKTNVG